MFYSNYDIVLTNNPVKLYIDGVEYKNVKKSNAPKKLLELTVDGDISSTIAFQRKRSGDTLQILSVFDDNRKLSNMLAHDNPKMLITHDRTALYLSLLMGIDIGYTVIRKDDNNKSLYYLITFVNQDIRNYTNKFDYRTNIMGGRNNSTYKKRFNKTVKRSKKMNHQELYNKLILPEVAQYRDKEYNIQHHLKYIENIYKFMYNENRKDDMIKYIQFNHSTNYTKDYISKLIFHEFIECINAISYNAKINLSYYIGYYYHFPSFVSSIYNIKSYEETMKEVLQHYDTSDKSFADYIRSLNCILWILRTYEDILINNRTFNSCNYEKLETLLTPELREQFSQEDDPEEWKPGDEPIRRIYYIMKYSSTKDKYKQLFDQVQYSCDWKLIDLMQITSYIHSHDVDTYTTLKTLAGDYHHGMYGCKPARPGVSSTAIMILGDLKYDFETKKEHTPEVHTMVEEVNTTPADLYKVNYDESLETILQLFKRTMDRGLEWGATIF